MEALVLNEETVVLRRTHRVQSRYRLRSLVGNETPPPSSLVIPHGTRPDLLVDLQQ